MIEKILEKLQAEGLTVHTKEYGSIDVVSLEVVSEVLEEVAKEYDWIPTEKAFPTENERVLCLTNRGRMETAIYRYSGFWACGSTWLKKVVAWQPLPAPYQKGE